MSLLRKKKVALMSGAGARHSELRKVLGASDLVMLGLGAMVGTGIFVLTGVAALQAGPALAISFILAATACALAALCYAEFASMIPVAGSGYTYSYATLGELVAWIVGWSLIAEYGLATAAVSVGWSGYFQSLISGVGLHLPVALTAAPGTNAAGEVTLFNLPAFAIMMLITAILSLGIRESKRVNNVLVVVKVVVVLLVIGVGFFYVEPENLTPYAPFGVSGVVSAAALVFFAFLGFDAVSSAAEEVRNPQRNLPIGLIGSLLICAALYALVATVATGIVPFADFKGVEDPIALVFQRADIEWMSRLVSIAAVTGMMTVILVMGYGLTRVVFAMSRDGLLPQWMSVINQHQVPVRSTWTLGTLSALIAATVPLSALAELINMGTLVAFAIISLAVPVLRRTQPELKRAFRVPMAHILGPVSALICVVLMLNLAVETWLAFGIWLAIGLVVYFGYSRRHAKVENLYD
ncbi:amino acid permease [Pseudomonas matsuisoli]|uniref:Amino-acid transporter protein n=1 Tax=Pseudomonas matsuisoli TaxID=1515666 RepID=A0A917PN37_9PSED|nr:amino acid permease [Pseudomonas matsuisoli]GGJ84989.1 amino-acid transporter protein [Pseudomonas matsuisoli]